MHKAVNVLLFLTAFAFIAYFHFFLLDYFADNMRELVLFGFSLVMAHQIMGNSLNGGWYE